MPLVISTPRPKKAGGAPPRRGRRPARRRPRQADLEDAQSRREYRQIPGEFLLPAIFDDHVTVGTKGAPGNRGTQSLFHAPDRLGHALVEKAVQYGRDIRIIRPGEHGPLRAFDDEQHRADQNPGECQKQEREDRRQAETIRSEDSRPAHECGRIDGPAQAERTGSAMWVTADPTTPSPT